MWNLPLYKSSSTCLATFFFFFMGPLLEEQLSGRQYGKRLQSGNHLVHRLILNDCLPAFDLLLLFLLRESSVAYCFSLTVDTFNDRCRSHVAGRRICADGLRQEHGESVMHQETGRPPWHHRAQDRCAAHSQVPQGLSHWRQLGHHPNWHNQEHCPCLGQIERGRLYHTTTTIHTQWEVIHINYM